MIIDDPFLVIEVERVFLALSIVVVAIVIFLFSF
jgi:hypothetical protein